MSPLYKTVQDRQVRGLLVKISLWVVFVENHIKPQEKEEEKKQEKKHSIQQLKVIK